MSIFEGYHFAVSLQRQVPFYVVLPKDAPPFLKESNPHYEREMKVVFLLHGMSENHSCYMKGVNLTDLAWKYNLAFVMPIADNSFYLNQKGTGKLYEDYIAKEVIETVRDTFGLSTERENNYILGISMGGYGALHLGLEYSETYEKIAAFSPALVQNEIKGIQPGFFNGLADYDFFTSTFGDLENLNTNKNNVEYQVVLNKKEGKRIPPIYQICGTEDFLYEKNQEFHKFLEEQEVAHTYITCPGVHDWIFWNEYMEKALVWLLEDK